MGKISDGTIDILQFRLRVMRYSQYERKSVRHQINATEELFDYFSGHKLNLVLKDVAESISVTPNATEFADSLPSTMIAHFWEIIRLRCVWCNCGSISLVIRNAFPSFTVTSKSICRPGIGACNSLGPSVYV